MSLSDSPHRIVMISGASRGIGHAVLERLLSRGHTVSAGVRRPADLAPAERLSVHRYDADDPESASAWVQATLARHGRLDALVNAAGISTPARMLDEDESAFGETWQINAMAPLRLIRAAWPSLCASGTGRVINVSSLSGKRVRNDNLGYAMSKFALIALTQEVRRQGWEHGIRATAVCPGFVRTDMTANVTRFPRDQMSRPEDIAAMIESVLNLPNSATVAELLINCRHEDLF